MSGKGTLGDMGVMVANLPDGVYPVDVKISDAKFVAEDGTTTVFDSLNSITSLDEDPEGGIRIHIRPTDEVDEETGEVTKKACPEVAGWEKEGAFNGGTLSMTLDFGVASAEPFMAAIILSEALLPGDTRHSHAILSQKYPARIYGRFIRMSFFLSTPAVLAFSVSGMAFRSLAIPSIILLIATAPCLSGVSLLFPCSCPFQVAP